MTKLKSAFQSGKARPCPACGRMIPTRADETFTLHVDRRTGQACAMSEQPVPKRAPAVPAPAAT
jgi:hypothetical protein